MNPKRERTKLAKSRLQLWNCGFSADREQDIRQQLLLISDHYQHLSQHCCEQRQQCSEPTSLQYHHQPHSRHPLKTLQHKWQLGDFNKASSDSSLLLAKKSSVSKSLTLRTTTTSTTLLLSSATKLSSASSLSSDLLTAATKTTPSSSSSSHLSTWHPLFSSSSPTKPTNLSTTTSHFPTPLSPITQQTSPPSLWPASSLTSSPTESVMDASVFDSSLPSFPFSPSANEGTPATPNSHQQPMKLTKVPQKFAVLTKPQLAFQHFETVELYMQQYRNTITYSRLMKSKRCWESPTKWSEAGSFDGRSLDGRSCGDGSVKSGCGSGGGSSGVARFVDGVDGKKHGSNNNRKMVLKLPKIIASQSLPTPPPQPHRSQPQRSIPHLSLPLIHANTSYNNNFNVMTSLKQTNYLMTFPPIFQILPLKSNNINNVMKNKSYDMTNNKTVNFYCYNFDCDGLLLKKNVHPSDSYRSRKFDDGYNQQLQSHLPHHHPHHPQHRSFQSHDKPSDQTGPCKYEQQETSKQFGQRQLCQHLQKQTYLQREQQQQQQQHQQKQQQQNNHRKQQKQNQDHRQQLVLKKVLHDIQPQQQTHQEQQRKRHRLKYNGVKHRRCLSESDY
ncbi:hypothetical protein HELRODRAFT_192348 [Helobdella robusta]|uniref:Uncharacterized protein n=1 Tax=Helobdella robusta TaxID=6412 RepID=T1FTU7_HELRO|nr:hypothetical protein HELRODRAFT_192348 [Helobdella robusta]ESO00998.1 hypothetical protein HELRODRAFT_192348 [Helobdella robusta]